MQYDIQFGPCLNLDGISIDYFRYPPRFERLRGKSNSAEYVEYQNKYSEPKKYT